MSQIYFVLLRIVKKYLKLFFNSINIQKCNLIYKSYFRRQIQEALNQQTYEQFRAYAEHWYPGNPEQVKL